MQRNYSDNTANTAGEHRCPNFPSKYFHNGGSSTPYFANCVLNSLFSLVTILASVFILVSVRKIASLRKPSKLLLGSVFLSEIGIGVIAQPSYVVFLFAKATQGISPMSCVAALTVNVSGSTLGCGCLLALTAVCLDRYLALFYYARYRTLVTSSRVTLLLCLIWVISIAWGTSWQWCNRLYYPTSIAILTACLCLTSFCYFKIYARLKHRQGRVEGRNTKGCHINLSVYRSSILNLLIIHVSLVLGFTPYLCAVLVVEFGGFTNSRLRALEFTTTVMLSRSAFNSVMCCWCIREVRANLLRTVCKCCHSSRD